MVGRQTIYKLEIKLRLQSCLLVTSLVTDVIYYSCNLSVTSVWAMSDRDAHFFHDSIYHHYWAIAHLMSRYLFPFFNLLYCAAAWCNTTSEPYQSAGSEVHNCKVLRCSPSDLRHCAVNCPYISRCSSCFTKRERKTHQTHLAHLDGHLYLSLVVCIWLAVGVEAQAQH